VLVPWERDGIPALQQRLIPLQFSMIHLLLGIVKRSFWQNWLKGLLVVPGPREI
jgi:hypothetical protein